jgi:hypothetical protein
MEQALPACLFGLDKGSLKYSWPRWSIFPGSTPVMSLPGVLGTILQKLPATAPNLFLAKTVVARWADWLARL